MGRTIDEKVVEMKFDNKDFEKNVRVSLSTLDKLKESLNLDKAVSKMESAKAAISKLKIFGGLDKEVEDVKVKFDGMRIFMERMVSNIADSFYKLGTNIIKNAFGPLTQGGMERALNIEQAKFQLTGLKVAWEDVYDSIDAAVSGTAFGLDAAAKAAAQLSASGVELGDNMTKALRGISGVAAMTNAQYEEISPIFTTVAGQGKLMTMQLRQLEARGLNVAAKLGEVLGVSEAQVRDMVTKGVIDFQTFANAMDDAFGEHAKDANNTFTGALSNMKFALKKIGAELATIYITNAKDVFNSIRNVINNVKTGLMPIIAAEKDAETGLYSIAYMLGKIVKTKAVEFFDNMAKAVERFTKLGGFINLAESLANVFIALYQVLKPIKKAFDDVFRSFDVDGVHVLFMLTEKLKEFTAGLRISDETGKAIYDTFKGVFTIFKNLLSVVGKVFRALLPVVKVLFNVIVSLSGVIGNIIFSFAEWAEEAKPLENILHFLGNAILALTTALVYGAVAIIDWVSQTKIFKTVANGIVKAVNAICNAFSKLKNWIASTFKEIALRGGGIENVVSVLSEKIPQALNNIYDNIQKNHPIINGIINAVTIAVGLLAAAVTELISIAKKVGEVLVDVVKSIQNSLKDGSLVPLIDKLKEKFSEFREVISGFLGDKSADPETIGEKLRRLGSAIKEFFANLDPGIVIAFAFSAAIINLLFNISQFVKIAGGLVNTISKFIKQFTSPVSKKLEILKSKILQFSVFVLSVAAALKIISTIEVDKLWDVVAILGVFTAVMLIFSTALEILDKKMTMVKGAGVSNVTTMIYAMAAAMLSIAVSLKILESIDADVKDMAIKVGAIVIAVGALAALSVLLSKFAGDKKMMSGVIAIAALSLGVFAVASALAKLSNLPMANVRDNIVVLITIMGMLSVLALAMAKIKLTGVVGILLLCYNIDLVLDALDKTFNNGSFQQIINGVKKSLKDFNDFVNNHMNEFTASVGAAVTIASAISVNIWVLSESIENMSKAFKNVASALARIGLVIVSIGLTMLMIAGTVAIFQKLSTQDNFDKAILWVAGFTAGLMIFIGVIAKLLKGADTLDSMDKDFKKIKESHEKSERNTTSAIKAMSKFMLAFGASMLILSASMKILSTISTDNGAFGRAIGSVLAVMLFMTAMVGIMAMAPSGDKIKTGPMIAVMAGLAIVIAEMVVLTTVAKNNIEELKVAAGAVGVACLAFAAIIYSLGSLASKSKDAKWGPLLVSLGGLVAVIAAMGVAMGIILNYSDDFLQIAAAGGSIILGMLTLMLLLKTISSSSGLGNEKTFWKKAVVIGATALAIVAIGRSVRLIASSSSDWSVLALSGGVILIGMATLALIIQSISETKVEPGVVGKVAIIVTVAGTLFVLGTVIGHLASTITDYAAFAMASGVILGGIAALMGILYLFMKASIDTNPAGMIGKIGSMLAACLIMISIGHALSEVAKQPWENIKAATEAMMKTMITLFAAIAIMSVVFGILADSEIGIIALVAIVAVLGEVVASLYGFAAAATAFAFAVKTMTEGITVAANGFELLIPQLQRLSELDLAKLGAGLIAVSLGIGAVGAAGIVLGIGALGIILAATGLGAMALALQLFTTIDFEALKTGMVSVVEAINELTNVSIAAVAVIIPLTSGMVAFALAAVGFGIAAALVGTGCYLIAASVTLAAGGLELLIPQLNALSEIDMLTMGTTMLTLALGLAAVGAAGIILSLSAIGINLAAVGLGLMAVSVMMFNGLDLHALAEGMNALKTGMAGLIVAGIQGLVAAIGIGALAASLAVLDAALLVSAGVFAMCMGLIQLSFVTTTAILSVKAFAAGYDAAKGLSYGMAAGSNMIFKAAGNMAKTVLYAISKAVGWNSPWVTTTTAGKDGLKGLIKGFTDSGLLSNLFSAVSKIASNIEIPFLDSFDSITNGARACMNILDEIFGFGSENTYTRKGGGGMPSDVANKVDAANRRLSSSVGNFQDILASIGLSFDDTEGGIGDLTSSMGDLTSGIGDFSDAVGGGGGGGGAVGSADDLANSLGDIDANTLDATESMKDFSTSTQQTKKAIEVLADNIRSQMNIFKEFSKGEEIAAEQMLSNMRSQVQGVAEWANNLRLLSERGISDGLLRELSEMGPQGYAEVQAFVKMTDAQLQEASDLFAASMSLPEATAEWLVEQFGIVGRDVSLGYAEGIDPRAGDERSYQMGINTLNAAKKALDIHSPSQKFHEIGVNICLGMLNGMLATMAQPINQARIIAETIVKTVKEVFLIPPSQVMYDIGVQICQGLTNGMESEHFTTVTKAFEIAHEVYDKFRDELKMDRFFSIGKHICLGIQRGIESGASGVINAAVDVAVSAYKAACAALAINSPSKLFMKVGSSVDEGFAKGIEDNERMVTSAVEEAGYDALDSLRSTMGMIHDIIDGRYELDPVIKPQIDLTDLDRGFQEIDGMMRQQKLSASMSGQPGELQNGQPSNYQFIQNNYSPKPLPRDEIYRQTKSQFSQFRKAVEGI